MFHHTVFASVILVSIISSHHTLLLDRERNCGGCLLLTPYIENGNVSLARSLCRVDPAKFLGVESHAGFITVKEEYASNLFFWFFPAKDLQNTPWIIWLQGGPGYSSLLGLFELIGPFKIKNGEAVRRDVTWTEDYSVLFLDNPVGAGFSHTNHDNGYPDNEDEVGAQMLKFLQQFLQMFPELREAPLFLAGQSYAGKYAPALGVQIHRIRNESYPINLRGIILGNPLIDPRTILHYSELCCALGLLEDNEVEAVKILQEETARLIDEGNMYNASNMFNETIEYIKRHSGVSIYNFNKDPGPLNKAPEFEIYLNRPYVRKAIGVGNITFNLNNQQVYTKMLPDIMNTTKPFVEELLEHYGVMCYHGQFDIMVAYSLAMRTYGTLNWSRRNEYDNAPRKRLRQSKNGDIVGFKKSGGNFADVLVRRAGHLLPKEQPEVAKYLLDHFIIEYFK